MLTQKEINTFNTEGYLIISLEISHKILDTIIEDTKYCFTKNNSDLSHHGTRIQDIWRDFANVKRVALLPQILLILDDLYKRRPLPFQTLNFYLGTQQKLHSDTVHFNSYPNNFMCGVWVALEDIDEENGPIIYCPGSHKLPEVTMQDVGKGITHDNYKFYEEYIGNLVNEKNLPINTACLKKGQAIIWHGNLLHGGSYHNDKKRTRHSMVTHYYFEGCQYYTPMLSTPDAVHYRTPDWIEMVAVDKFISDLQYKSFNLNAKTNQ